MRIVRPPLALTFDASTHAYTVTNSDSGRCWTFAAPPGAFEDTATAKVDEHSFTVSFKDTATHQGFRCRVVLTDDGVVTFRLAADDAGASFGALQYPPKPKSALKRGMMLFCDRAGGNYVPLNDPKFSKGQLIVYGNTDALDMPWLGLVDDDTGEGLMMLAETPTEVTFLLSPDEKGEAWPQPAWFSSFGTFAYERVITYRFVSEGGYVRQAKLFRQWAETHGLVKTLAQKTVERPRVEWLRGAMVVWGCDGLRFAREARAAGVRRALLNGKYAPSDMRQIKDMGMLTGAYDNYSDIVDGEIGPTSDRVEDVAFRDPDGSPRKGWLAKDGKQYYMRATSQTRKAAETLIPPILAELPYTARFLDVHSALQLFEDYNPARHDDRRQDLKYRQDLYAYIGSLGLVVGGEHGKSWGVPYLDYTEGMMSGPFWWQMDVGHLLPLKSREDISKDYLDYGINAAVRIPLWELAYHDCLVTTWYWGDSNGYLYEVAPELSETKDLLNILYGTVPLVWANHLDYGWDRHRDRLLRTYYTTCPLHEHTGFTPMTEHTFLSPDRLVQRTRFASGVTVSANFADEARHVAATDGHDVLLAPRGFLVEGEGIVASREWIDGAPVTRMHVGEFWYFDAPPGKSVAFGPFQGSGEVAGFKTDDGMWRMRVAGGGDVRVDLTVLCEPPSRVFRATELDSLGRNLSEVAVDANSPTVHLSGGKDARLFGLFPGIEPERPLILSRGEEVSTEDTIAISTASRDVTVRYTLDGSEPSATSTVYVEPFRLERGATVKARAFRGDAPVGAESIASFVVARRLLDTGVLRGGEAARHVELSMKGHSRLEITVSDGGDGTDYDQASLGNPRFIGKDGAATYLGDLKPLAVTYSTAKIVVDGGAKREGVVIAGERFPRSVWLHAPARLVYAVNPDQDRFEAWVGVPDSTNPNHEQGKQFGSVAFTFMGVSSAP